MVYNQELEETKRKLVSLAESLTKNDNVHFTIKDVPFEGSGRYQQVVVIIEKDIKVKDPCAIPELPRFDWETGETHSNYFEDE